MKLQAIYKMKKQKSLYGEMRERAEMERQARVSSLFEPVEV